MRVLITGSSGFIGSHLAQRFRDSGWDVAGIGRRPLDQPGYLRHDLAEPLPSSREDNYDVVIHAAARSNPWGTWQQFQMDNVMATDHVISFCRRIGTPRLIYLSSSSVYYEPRHQWDITESTPLPRRSVNAYAATKRLAEERIRAYPGSWVILRPRAVFGPGDTVLLPRILEAARRGRLPLLHAPDGPVIGDLIYIDNLVDAVERAATLTDRDVFNLTNHQPVPILEFLLTVFDRLGIPRPTRRFSARTAMVLAGLLEGFHRVVCPSREPVLTRFGVHVFRYSKTFDVRHAARTFGPPRISLDEGLERTVAWFRQPAKEALP